MDNQSQENKQEGGWAKGASKTAKLQLRLKKIKDGNKKIVYKKGKNAGQTKTVTMPTYTQKGVEKEHSHHAKRSYKAFINGAELVGKSTKGGETRRYFHGEPLAAAKKVVSQLKKGGTNVDGVANAQHIKLEEVTKGVRKVKGDHFSYEYYGWREAMTAKPKLDKNGQPMKDKEGKVITFTGKNRAVPVRDAKSAQEALNKSTAIGAKIKDRKTKGSK